MFGKSSRTQDEIFIFSAMNARLEVTQCTYSNWRRRQACTHVAKVVGATSGEGFSLLTTVLNGLTRGGDKRRGRASER